MDYNFDITLTLTLTADAVQRIHYALADAEQGFREHGAEADTLAVANASRLIADDLARTLTEFDNAAGIEYEVV